MKTLAFFAVKIQTSMKIYTKTGDNGKTSLVGGTRVAKNDMRLEAYGTIDELNAFVGLLITHLSDSDTNVLFLKKIQNNLFSIGAYLATDNEKVDTSNLVVFEEDEISLIEQEIDNLNAALPPLKAFVLPGSTHTEAVAHICRTVTRRAERRIYDVAEHFFIVEKIHVYINRLSDYFFILSRFLTKESGKEEIFWKNLC